MTSEASAQPPLALPPPLLELATTGAAGIVTGLALRNLLAGLSSGTALRVEHSFHLDDFVLLHLRGKRDLEPSFAQARAARIRSFFATRPAT